MLCCLIKFQIINLFATNYYIIKEKEGENYYYYF